MGIHRGKHPISYQRNKLLKLQRTAGRKNVRIPLFRNLCLFFSAQMQYLFHWICAVLCLVAQSCATVWIPWTEEPGRLQSVGILQARTLEWVAMPSSRIFPTQEIFPSQGLNPGLLHCRQILYSLSHQGSPRTLEWAAYPFCRGTSQPRNRTRVSCIASRFFTSWATQESHFSQCHILNNSALPPLFFNHLECLVSLNK